MKIELDLTKKPEQQPDAKEGVKDFSVAKIKELEFETDSNEKDKAKHFKEFLQRYV